jgi:hypothetical protein
MVCSTNDASSTGSKSRDRNPIQAPYPRTDIYTKYRCGSQEVSLANHARINTKPKNEDTTHKGKTKRKIPINNEHKHCPLNTSTHQISSECLKERAEYP